MKNISAGGRGGEGRGGGGEGRSGGEGRGGEEKWGKEGGEAGEGGEGWGGGGGERGGWTWHPTSLQTRPVTPNPALGGVGITAFGRLKEPQHPRKLFGILQIHFQHEANGIPNPIYLRVHRSLVRGYMWGFTHSSLGVQVSGLVGADCKLTEAWGLHQVVVSLGLVCRVRNQYLLGSRDYMQWYSQQPTCTMYPTVRSLVPPEDLIRYS